MKIFFNHNNIFFNLLLKTHHLHLKFFTIQYSTCVLNFPVLKTVFALVFLVLAIIFISILEFVEVDLNVID